MTIQTSPSIPRRAVSCIRSDNSQSIQNHLSNHPAAADWLAFECLRCRRNCVAIPPTPSGRIANLSLDIDRAALDYPESLFKASPPTTIDPDLTLTVCSHHPTFHNKEMPHWESELTDRQGLLEIPITTSWNLPAAQGGIVI